MTVYFTNLWQHYYPVFAPRCRLGGWAASLLVLVATACSAQPAAPTPSLAIVSRADNGVTITTVGRATPLPAGTGTGLPTGATLTTAGQAAATIDFGAGAAVYLQSRTSVTLLRIAALAQGMSVGIQLSTGRLLAVMPGGSLEVSTTQGQVVLNGSASVVEFAPSALGTASDVFTIVCLSGGCSVNARVYSGGLGRSERLSISNSGLTVDKSQLSEADVVALLSSQSGDQAVAVTLTTWPTSDATPVAVTPTLPVALANTALPTRTLVPTRNTTTPEPTAAPTETPTASAQWQNVDIAGVSNNFNSPANNYGYNSVVVDPTSPNLIYVGTNYQGIYRSTNSGATWTKIDTGAGSNLVDGGRIWTLAIDPFNHQTLYAASGYGAGGPLKSTDGGVSWINTLPTSSATEQHLGTNDIYNVVLDPYTPNHLLASFHNYWLPGTSDPGVIESTNGGATWTIHNPPPGSGWGAENNVWFLNDGATWLLGSQHVGFWRTTNGGTSWIRVSANNVTAGGINALYRDPDTGVLVAAHWKGMMKSTDNGASWTDFSAGLPFGSYETIMSDGTHFYTAPSFPDGGDYGQAHGPWYTVALTGSTWTAYNSQQTCDSSNSVCNGPVMMARDAANNILYSVNWLGGFWKLAAPPR